MRRLSLHQMTRKGIALGISFAGSGIGAALMNPLSTMVTESHDWRHAFFFADSMSLLILIPTILFLIKDTPESVGLKPYRNRKANKETSMTATLDIEGMTFKEAKKSPLF